MPESANALQYIYCNDSGMIEKKTEGEVQIAN